MSTMVDILPSISPTGNFKKITDSSTYNNNNKVSTLFNVLEYCEGKNSMYPEMGVYKLLNSIPYSDNPEAIVNRISTILSEFLDFTVEVDFNYTDDTKEIMEITLKVVGLPGVVKAGVKKTNETIKLINPRYFK